MCRVNSKLSYLSEACRVGLLVSPAPSVDSSKKSTGVFCYLAPQPKKSKSRVKMALRPSSRSYVRFSHSRWLGFPLAEPAGRGHAQRIGGYEHLLLACCLWHFSRGRRGRYAWQCRL